PGLLAGDTPVAENEGLDWPLRFLAPRLEHFHRRSLPVDAIGVGVDRLQGGEALDLFNRAFRPIRSWSVRTPSCCEALIQMGVPANRIVVGADWAWAYPADHRRDEWGRSIWRSLDIDLRSPLLVANVVNMVWRDARAKANLAAALDRVRRELGMQIAFFSNETRAGEFFDDAAAQEMSMLMRERSVLVPREYYSPDEAIALLACATATLGQRYHFAVESVLAGAVPVCIVRGAKMKGLVDELGLAAAGSVDMIEPDQVFQAVQSAVSNRASLVEKLDAIRHTMAERASHNLDLVRGRPPFAGSEHRSFLRRLAGLPWRAK